MPQGKCTPCKTRYRWPGKRHLVRDACCPACLTPLDPTSQNANLPTKEILAPARVRYARRMR